MSVSITGKLNKAATEFAAGDSIGFGLRLGQQYYDRKTSQKEWTNYSCVVFAKAGPQADFYRSTLIEGTVVAVSGKEQRIDQYEGQNGVSLSIEILNSSIDNVFTMEGQGQAQPSNPTPQPQQGGFNQPPAQPQSFGSFATPSAPAHDPWSDYMPSPTTNGATIDQVKAKYNGDLQAAVTNGHVVENDELPF